MNKTCKQRHIGVWRLMVETHTMLLDLLERELMQELGLPLTWHEVLVNLRRSPTDALRMSDLADSVLLSKSGLTRLVDRMEASGYLERRSCDSDRRGAYATITDSGKSAVDLARPIFIRVLTEHFAQHLSDADLESLKGILGRVHDSAEQALHRSQVPVLT